MGMEFLVLLSYLKSEIHDSIKEEMDLRTELRNKAQEYLQGISSSVSTERSYCSSNNMRVEPLSRNAFADW
jgi:hypothetical protein